jgi:hypothetical protein
MKKQSARQNRARLFRGAFLAIGLLVIATARPTSANLIVNGDFETGTFAGWTMTPASTGSNFGVGPVPPAHDTLGAFFRANGPDFDSISQTFVTTPGAFYDLSFFYEIVEPGSPPDNGFRAIFNNVVVYENLNAISGFGPFTFHHLQATGSTTTVEFQGRSAHVMGSDYLDDVSVTASCQFSTSITSNFNASPINSGNYIWFTSVLSPKNLGSNPVTIYFTGQTITIPTMPPITLSVPDATVTFDPNVNFATTTFGPGGVSMTTVPSNPTLKGNTFFSGLDYQVPMNLPGGIHNVTWSGTISTDTPSVKVQWKWAAAVYTMFDADYNLLGVKPVDDKVQNPYLNADHAGTPENFKPFVIGGATGGGGANYTGGLSGTAAVGPCQP